MKKISFLEESNRHQIAYGTILQSDNNISQFDHRSLCYNCINNLLFWILQFMLRLCKTHLTHFKG